MTRNNSSKLKCGIIGCGNIAGKFDTPESKLIRTHAKAFKNHKYCELIGVCDIDFKEAKEFAKMWCVGFFSNDLDEFLKKYSYDILSICTPTKTHSKIFSKIVEHKPKIIWIEKPSSSNVDEIKKMISLKNPHFEVWVNYFRRFTKEFLNVKSKINNIGKIQKVICYYSKGLQNNGSHLIDLVINFFGPVHDIVVLKRKKNGIFIDVDLILKTKITDVYIFSAHYKYFEIFEMDILGQKGRIEIKNNGAEVKIYKVERSKSYRNYKNLEMINKKTNILDKFMLENLNFSLKYKRNDDLNNDLTIQNIVKSALEKEINENI